MIWKLLRSNVSQWQLAGYAVAALVGLTVISVAVQLHADLSVAIGSDSPRRMITLSKTVSAGDTFRGTTPAFTDAELSELARQPWVADMAPLRAADFPVHAGVSLGGRAMTTALFFESVPRRFLDVDSAVWRFDPAAPMVPVVIPRDYLALYNFGFAASGGMPAMSEGMFSALPLTVIVGNTAEVLPARIVGYSDWLNTIAVPDGFLAWASGRHGTGTLRAPSRVVVSVSAPGDPAVDAWLSARGYAAAGAGDAADRASHLITAVAGAVAGVGALITLMALVILLLSLSLLVTRNRPVISGLLMLGYTPGQVSAGYMALVGAVNVAVLLAACVAIAALRTLWAAPLAAAGTAGASVWWSVGTAVSIMATLTLLDALVLRRLTRKCFR